MNCSLFTCFCRFFVLYSRIKHFNSERCFICIHDDIRYEYPWQSSTWSSRHNANGCGEWVTSLSFSRCTSPSITNNCFCPYLQQKHLLLKAYWIGPSSRKGSFVLLPTCLRSRYYLVLSERPSSCCNRPWHDGACQPRLHCLDSFRPSNFVRPCLHPSSLSEEIIESPRRRP